MGTEKTAFENLLESLTSLLSSNDSSLDQLQEIVDFIKANREKIENLSVSEINGLNDALNLKVNIADIVDGLTSTLGNVPLSANQGKVLDDKINVLQESIETLKGILTSDDTTLDELQEIVNFIKQNREDLENLDLSNIAETSELKHFTKILLDKLDGIEEGANKYVHPSTHDATMITEDETHRFVTEMQIEHWNSKADEDTNTWRPISDSVTSADSNTSASSTAVKTAYDRANSAYALANAASTSTTLGAVGTYAFLACSRTCHPGGFVAGSNLYYGGIYSAYSEFGGSATFAVYNWSSISGTWKAMGYGYGHSVSLFLRIA